MRYRNGGRWVDIVVGFVALCLLFAFPITLKIVMLPLAFLVKYLEFGTEIGLEKRSFGMMIYFLTPIVVLYFVLSKLYHNQQQKR